MKNLDPEFCKRVKSARREAGLTQGELAAEVGCKQSALSMFEQGDGTKLNDDVVEKIAKKFNLVYAADGEDGSRNVDAAASRPQCIQSGFCPNPHCPTNHEYFVEEMRLFRPDRSAADPVGGRYCAMCGELLERKCPNCGAPVHAGAVCSFCGQPYIASLQAKA